MNLIKYLTPWISGCHFSRSFLGPSCNVLLVLYLYEVWVNMKMKLSLLFKLSLFDSYLNLLMDLADIVSSGKLFNFES